MVQITTAVSLLLATAAIAPVLALPYMLSKASGSAISVLTSQQKTSSVSLRHKHSPESHLSLGRHVDSEGREKEEEELSAHLEPYVVQNFLALIFVVCLL